MGTNATKKAASKIVAILLAALMLISVMPMTAFAAPKATIVVEGITVYESGDFVDTFVDDDEHDKFSFNGLSIEVTYRSLTQIEAMGDKAPRAKVTIDGYNADLWSKYGLSCNLKEGKNLSVADNGTVLVFKFGTSASNVLKTNFDIIVAPNVDTETWVSAEEVKGFAVASSSDAEDKFGTNADAPEYDLDDAKGIYIAVANGNIILSGKDITVNSFVDSETAQKSVKVVKGIKVNGAFIQDVEAQFDGLSIWKNKDGVELYHDYFWTIDGDVAFAPGKDGRDVGYELTLVSEKGKYLNDKFVKDEAQLRDDAWPLIADTSAADLSWILTDEGYLYTINSYVDSSKDKIWNVETEQWEYPEIETAIYVAVTDKYAYLTADKADAAKIKLYRLAEGVSTVNNIEVAQNPDKMNYVEGQALDLAGMKVNLMYNDNVVLTVPAEQFGYYGITTVPAAGTAMKADVHNDQVIIAKYNAATTQVKALRDETAEIIFDGTDKALSVVKSSDATTGTLLEGGKLTDGTYAIVWVESDTDKLLSKAAYEGIALENKIVTDDKAGITMQKPGSSSYDIKTLGAFGVDIFDKAIAADLANAKWNIKYDATERAYTIQDAKTGKYLTRNTNTYKDLWVFDLNTNSAESDEYIAQYKTIVLADKATADSYWLINGSFDASIQSAAEAEDNFYLIPHAADIYSGLAFAEEKSKDSDADVDNYYFFKLADFGFKALEVVTQPTLKYNSGDKLDLHALVVKATYTDGSTKLIPYDEFNSYGLTVANGDKVLAASDNGKTVVISLGKLTASTDKLVVADTQSAAKVVRMGGADRYETAAIIANNYITALGAEYKNVAVLVNSEQFPDALAGSTLAAALKAPIVISKADSLNAKTKAVLVDNKVNTVYVLGGNNAIGANVISALKALNINVKVIAGANRVETSVAIAKELAAVKGYSDTVIVTNGANFADALSVSSAAAKNGTPILYVNGQGSLSADVKDFIANAKASKAVILGGTAAVSDSIAAELKALGLTVDRAAGADRFETSIAIAKYFDAAYNDGVVALATGRTFPDALAGGVYASLIGAPVVLVDNGYANADAALYIAGLDLTNAVVFGGPEAVSDATVAAALLK